MPVLEVNISQVLKDVASAINSNKKEISREIANAVSTKMARRIFTEGKASDGGQIGTYSSSYLKYRQRKYNRTGDRKVTVSLTRQLENNFGVVEADNEAYGIGVINGNIGKRMSYVESIKDKNISDMTEDETTLAETAAAKALDRILDQ